MEQKNAFELLNPQLIENLKTLGIEQPTSVQQNVIPLINEGKNVIFQSETGTGKTFAFALPLISRIFYNCEEIKNEHPKIIIVSPTFELSSQIKQAIQSVCSIRTSLFIGGTPLKRQIESFKEKPQIIVGTMARLVELIQLKKLKTQELKAIVFDEADRLVKRESLDDLKMLLSLMPEKIQTVALSATIDSNTKKFFNGELILLPPEDVLKKSISHWALYAESREKIDVLRKFLLAENPEKALIFTSRADQVENIYSKLKYKKIDCYALHSKTDKQLRKATIDRFKSGKIKILITSDLSARGLDIQNITHIIQMDLPDDTDFFVHRAGRTARAGKKGINVVIGDEYEMNSYSRLEKKFGLTVYPKQIRNGKVCEPEL